MPTTDIPALELPFPATLTPAITAWFQDVGGLTFNTSKDDPITAAADGLVIEMIQDEHKQVSLTLLHRWGRTIYQNGQHQSIPIEFTLGCTVSKGDRIMRAGATPLLVSAEQLDGTPLDPWLLFNNAYEARLPKLPEPPANQVDTHIHEDTPLTDPDSTITNPESTTQETKSTTKKPKNE